MSVRVVGMQNGEDVIADVKEMRNQDGTPLAYKLDFAYALTLQPNKAMLLEEGESMDLDHLDVEFQTYVPLSKHSYIMVPIPSVALIYEPHDNLLSKYNELLEENAKDTNTTIKPPDTPDGNDDRIG